MERAVEGKRLPGGLGSWLAGHCPWVCVKCPIYRTLQVSFVSEISAGCPPGVSKAGGSCDDATAADFAGLFFLLLLLLLLLKSALMMVN